MSQTTTTGTEEMSLPTTMRAWQWSTCGTTLEEAIELKDSVPLPTSKRPLAAGESLIQVHAAALNPVDYKLAELPVVGRMAIPKPATPGLDFAGRVVQEGPGCSVIWQTRAKATVWHTWGIRYRFKSWDGADT